MNDRDLLEDAHEIAVAAGEEILAVYNNHDFDVETKGDGSPLTLADRRAHGVIEKALTRLTPEIPVLSEESDNEVFEQRLQWSRFWLVDPLDGTKEFVRRNGEFTVNIALIDRHVPVLGVVHTPVQGVTYYASLDGGAFRQQAGEAPTQIRVRKVNPQSMTMVASRSHGAGAVDSYRNNMLQTVADIKFASMGSSLKLCLVAEGRADVYPRLAPTSEWDTAAAHCVVTAAGGSVTRLSGTPLVYNKPNILNPWFLVGGDPDYDWTAPARGIEEPDD